MEERGSLPHSQQPTTETYVEEDKFSPKTSQIKADYE
jgi:hypothetical protein